MPTIELVDREEATSYLGGSIFPGSAVRVIARSPTHFLFTSLGAQIWSRSAEKNGSWQGTARLFYDRGSIARFTAAIPVIDEIMGQGVGAAVVEAWRKRKTVLVDGGGVQLKLPRPKAIKLAREAYALVDPSARLDLQELRRCRQCGEQLRPDTDAHHIDYHAANHPRSLEDCQRLTNRRVIACHGYGLNHPERAGMVSWFDSWDGESYRDPDFCDNACAAAYGRRAVAERELLEPGIEPPERKFRRKEFIDHDP